jgi:hypothetical protein
LVIEFDDATGDCLPPVGTGSQNATTQGKERKKSGRKLSVVATGVVPDVPSSSPDDFNHAIGPYKITALTRQTLERTK